MRSAMIPRLNDSAPRLRAHGRLTDPRGRGRTLAFVLGTMMVIVAVLAPILLHALAPARLSDSHLAGARGPAPLRVVLLLDESGSFAQYSDLRAQTLDQVAAWAPRNLRSDDTIEVYGFAGHARTVLPPTRVDRLPGSIVYRGFADGDGTSIIPALTAAADASRTPGASDAAASDASDASGARSSGSGSSGSSAPASQTTIIAVTDTKMDDLGDGDAIDAIMRRIGVSSMTLILPKGIHPTPGWKARFGYEQEVRANVRSQDSVAMAIGKALAFATRQELRH